VEVEMEVLGRRLPCPLTFPSSFALIDVGQIDFLSFEPPGFPVSPAFPHPQHRLHLLGNQL